MINDRLDAERRHIGETYNQYGITNMNVELGDGNARWDPRLKLNSEGYKIFCDYASGAIAFTEVSEILNSMVDQKFVGYTRQQG